LRKRAVSGRKLKYIATPIRVPYTSPMKTSENIPGNLAAEIGRHIPFETLEQEVFLNMLRTSEYVSANLGNCFKEFGVTQPQYNVLKILEIARENKASIKKIGERLVTREPDVTRLVDRLEKAGLVQRRRCSSDRRVIYVKLQEGGKRILEQLGPVLMQEQKKLMRHMGPDKLSALNRLLFELRHPEIG